MSRIAIAFFVAPLAVPLVLVPYLWLRISTPSLFLFALIVSVAFSYGGTLVFGLPAYSLLRMRLLTSFWVAPVVGFAIGAIVWVLFLVSFVLSLEEGISGVRSVLKDPGALSGVVWPGGLSGATVGIIFWMIAHPRP
jgi:hypothetical protein